jgi:hypothetical protein
VRSAVAVAQTEQPETKAAAPTVQQEQEQRAAEAAAARYNPVVRDAAAFAQAISALNSERTGGTYTITLTGSINADPVVFTSNAAKTIILKGDDNPRTMRNNGSRALFTVPSGITLVLDNNISLNGNDKQAVIVAVDGGTLIMKTGSALYGAGKNGVSLNNRASFTMQGGDIGDNSANEKGGGVCVASGTLSKRNRGTIDDTNSAREGKVAYVYSSRQRNTTAGPGVTLNSNIAGGSGGWE